MQNRFCPACDKNTGQVFIAQTWRCETCRKIHIIHHPDMTIDNHIRDLNAAIDVLGPLVARFIDKLYPLAREEPDIYKLRQALDAVTDVQNRQYTK